MTKLEAIRVRCFKGVAQEPDDVPWLLERVEELEIRNNNLRCSLEAAVNTAETYNKMLSAAATVAKNIGRLHGDALPKNAREALARLADTHPRKGLT